MTGIKNESRNGLKNSRGTLAMARYDDPNSATSQFFIISKTIPILIPPEEDLDMPFSGK